MTGKRLTGLLLHVLAQGAAWRWVVVPVDASLLEFRNEQLDEVFDAFGVALVCGALATKSYFVYVPARAYMRC